jgi:hypothetical protein
MLTFWKQMNSPFDNNKARHVVFNRLISGNNFKLYSEAVYWHCRIPFFQLFLILRAVSAVSLSSTNFICGYFFKKSIHCNNAIGCECTLNFFNFLTFKAIKF